jgi:hypothetical protein
MAGMHPTIWQHSPAATYQGSATTSYTTVTARRSFPRPDASAHGSYSPASSLSSHTVQPTPPPIVKKVEWPQPVRDYVFRSFQTENLIAGIGNDEMQAKLKKTLSTAAESGQLDGIDWATLPLPQQLIQQERAMASWNSQGYNDNGWISLEQPDSGSKKRKYVADATSDMPIPPREKDNTANGFDDRVQYATKAQQSKWEKRMKKQQEALGKGTSKFQAQAEKRKQRFGAQLEDSPPWEGRSNATPPQDVPIGPVVGTCQKLEKQYFRLNGAPKPEDVRPLDVLQQAFDHIKQKWMDNGNYVYTCDQFKSIRQDLTVQRIKNDFTVKVYELHARIALEMADLGEYNQCQTQLRALYSLKLEGHPAEFMAYRILYFVHTCNRIALNDILAEITPELRQSECVKHALAVRSAQASGNYHKLLANLYQSVPNMGAYLMDMFVARERIAALATICKSYVTLSTTPQQKRLLIANRYKPNVSIQFLAEELGFDTYESTVEFLDKAGADNAGALVRPVDEAEVKELGKWKLDTAKGASVFQAARASAFRFVDIKGQV